MKWPKLIPELTVLDFNESYKFYVDVLGFEVENVRTNPNFAYLKLDEAHLMIEEHHEEGWNVGGLKYPLGLDNSTTCPTSLRLKDGDGDSVSDLSNSGKKATATNKNKAKRITNV